MVVYRNSVLNFTWDDNKTNAPGINLAAGASVLAVAGIAAGASLQTAFMRTVGNHESYDRLDTYTVQPTEDYIEECLEQDKLKEITKGKLSWSMFMITGIKVARGGRREVREEKGTVFDIGPNLDVPALATLKATVNNNRASSQGSSGEYQCDFIWAIRLAKVHKGLLMRDWSVTAHTERATFAEEGEANVEGALTGEGLEDFKIIDDAALDEAIVIDRHVIQ